MINYKPILSSILLYSFGYFLIILSNATFVLQSAILSILIISTLYSLIGFLWGKKDRYIFIPLALHFLIVFILTSKSDETISSMFLKIGILFLTPILCFWIAKFLKEKKNSYLYLILFLLIVNIPTALICSNQSFEKSKYQITTNNNIDSTYILVENNFINFKDSTFSRLALTNKTVVLDFWFVNCKPCRELMPYFVSLSESYKQDTNIVFLSINNGEIDKYAKANKFLEDQNVDKSHFGYDRNGNISKFFQVNKYPELIIINKNGKISYSRGGFNSDEIFVFSKKMHEIIDKIKQE